jgi:hypothetical protein
VMELHQSFERASSKEGLMDALRASTGRNGRATSSQ